MVIGRQDLIPSKTPGRWSGDSLPTLSCPKQQRLCSQSQWIALITSMKSLCAMHRILSWRHFYFYSIHYSHGKKQSYFKSQTLYGRNWWGTHYFSSEYIFDIKIISLNKKLVWRKVNSGELNLDEANFTWALLWKITQHFGHDT